MFVRFLLAVLLGVASYPAFAADETFDSNGVKIRYVSEGEGEAVVLIHGWMSDAGMWGKDKSGRPKPNAKDAPGFRVIALDCRGHGRSDKPHDPAKYGPEMAADVVRLLDHLKIDKAHLIGYSSGAFVAGKVVATHPGRVRSVVYAGQAPLIAGEKSSGRTEVDVFADAVDAGRDLGEYILAVTPADRFKLTAEQASSVAKFRFAGKDVKAFAAAGRGFAGLAATAEELKACPAPVLFVHGGDESAAVKDRVTAVRKLLGRGELKVIDGGDHMTTLARPEFGAALVAFLNANKAK